MWNNGTRGGWQVYQDADEKNMEVTAAPAIPAAPVVPAAPVIPAAPVVPAVLVVSAAPAYWSESIDRLNRICEAFVKRLKK
jgi:hypothetical protein